jgi:cellulose synthase/poly-beta-1,6-N-acetylglucosamine synthase-like glycosyltransferase
MLVIIAALVAGVSGFPLLVLTAETLAGLRAPKYPAANDRPPRTTVIIPAHDEKSGIASTIGALRPGSCDILVVADNCSDDTATVARAAGARVVERCDPALRGKGHALAFARAALSNDPPDVVIIMDADCVPVADALIRLAGRVAQTGRAVQARNELDTRPDDPPMIRISNFAFSLKNVVRQRGLMRIAGTCVLTGTGMAFPWAQFRDAPLATSDSVEDLAIGLALVGGGQAPTYLDDARVTSPPASGRAAVTQRTRWEHGFIATASRVAPRMIGHGIANAQWPSFWLGLHLMVPPLALTFGLAMLALVVVLGLGFTSSFVPAAVLAMIIGVAGLAVFAGWRAVGRNILPFGTLLRVPLYIAWKLPIYLKLARGADRRWTRTERD